MGIIGELGAGKTLSLTYLAYRNYLKGKNIFSNYHLEFPHTKIRAVEEFDKMKDGFFAGDEMWLWLDARSSITNKNKIISAILLKSRKRNIHLAYTTQSFSQVDRRIRNITDLLAIPVMSPNNSYCMLHIVTNPSQQLVKTYRYRPSDYYNLYDTTEEISSLDF